MVFGVDMVKVLFGTLLIVGPVAGLIAFSLSPSSSAWLPLLCAISIVLGSAYTWDILRFHLSLSLPIPSSVEAYTTSVVSLITLVTLSLTMLILAAIAPIHNTSPHPVPPPYTPPNDSSGGASGAGTGGGSGSGSGSGSGGSGRNNYPSSPSPSSPLFSQVEMFRMLAIYNAGLAVLLAAHWKTTKKHFRNSQAVWAGDVRQSVIQSANGGRGGGGGGEEGEEGDVLAGLLDGMPPSASFG